MVMRKGMMKGSGKRGYHNLIGKDPMVHSQSAKGIKQPQRFPFTKGITHTKSGYWKFKESTDEDIDAYHNASETKFQKKLIGDYGKVLEDNPPNPALISFNRKKYLRKIKVSPTDGWYVVIDGQNVRVR